jgi:hypothetical protein
VRMRICHCFDFFFLSGILEAVVDLSCFCGLGGDLGGGLAKHGY